MTDHIPGSLANCGHCAAYRLQWIDSDDPPVMTDLGAKMHTLLHPDNVADFYRKALIRETEMNNLTHG